MTMQMHHDKQPIRSEPLALVEFDRSGTTVAVDAVWWTSPLPTLQLGRRAAHGAVMTIRIPPRFRHEFLRAVEKWVALCDAAQDAPEAPRPGQRTADYPKAIPDASSGQGGAR